MCSLTALQDPLPTCTPCSPCPSHTGSPYCSGEPPDLSDVRFFVCPLDFFLKMPLPPFFFFFGYILSLKSQFQCLLQREALLLKVSASNKIFFISHLVHICHRALDSEFNNLFNFFLFYLFYSPLYPVCSAHSWDSTNN